MSAAELLEELKVQGVEISVDGENITCRSKQPLSEELVVRLRNNKSRIIKLLKRRTVNPYLDDQGRLCIRGLPPDHLSRLELLVCLDASSNEIEKHIHPIGTPDQWRQWISIDGQNGKQECQKQRFG